MHCPICSSVRLTPRGTLAVIGHSGTVAAMWQDASQTGFLRIGVSTSADRVVVCGDCGYFLLFASQEALQDVRAHWNQLVPAT